MREDIEIIDDQIVTPETHIKLLRSALSFVIHHGVEHGKVSFGDDCDYFAQNTDWGWKSAEYLDDSDTVAFGVDKECKIYLLPNTSSLCLTTERGVLIEIAFTLPKKQFEFPNMNLVDFCLEHRVDTRFAGLAVNV